MRRATGRKIASSLPFAALAAGCCAWLPLLSSVAAAVAVAGLCLKVKRGRAAFEQQLLQLQEEQSTVEKPQSVCSREKKGGKTFNRSCCFPSAPIIIILVFFHALLSVFLHLKPHATCPATLAAGAPAASAALLSSSSFASAFTLALLMIPTWKSR